MVPGTAPRPSARTETTEDSADAGRGGVAACLREGERGQDDSFRSHMTPALPPPCPHSIRHTQTERSTEDRLQTDVDSALPHAEEEEQDMRGFIHRHANPPQGARALP
jgi:hypothetical protein